MANRVIQRIRKLKPALKKFLKRFERCFEDQKYEIGSDRYEGRRHRGLRRHLILRSVSHLFLSRMRQEFGGKIRS